MFFVLACFFSFIATNLFIYSSIIFVYGHSYPVWVAGAFYGLCFVPFLLLSIPIGRLTDKVTNKKRIIVASHCGLAGLILLTTLLAKPASASPQLFLLVGLLFGLTFLFIPSFRYGLISELFERAQQPKTLILLNVLSVLSLSCAPLLHAWMINMAGERGGMQAALAAICCATVLYQLVPKNNLSAVKDIAVESHFKPGLKPVILCMIGIFLLGPLQSILPKLISHKFLLEGTSRDFVMASIGAGMILSVPFVNLINKLNLAKSDLALALGICTCCPLIAFAPTLPLLVLAILATSMLACALVNRNQARLQQETPAGCQGRLMALVALINMGVPAVSGFLGSVLAGLSSPQGAFVMLSLVLAALVVFMMYLDAAKQQVAGDVSV